MGINEVLFGIQTLVVIFFGIFFASKGKGWLMGWLSLLSIVMNIFVLKQVRLGCFEATSADVYMIGLLTSLNCARELYDRESVNEAMLGSWIVTLVFLVLAQLHLALVPSIHDSSQEHFLALFSPAMRLVLASLVTMMVVQVVDGRLFSWLQKLCKKRFFGIRNALTLAVSQIIDTVLFSFLGLYGIVANLTDAMFLALLLKGIFIILSMPITVFANSLGKSCAFFKQYNR